MKHVGYILKTKSYYITCLILIVVFLIVSVVFANTWARIDETLTTFNQCSANVIAYDPISDTKDSFANFERGVSVSLTGEDGEVFNVFVYQFLEDTTYTDKTIVNTENTLFGEFQILSANEIALPISIAKQYDLSLGDAVFVGKKECQLKYIYRDIYQIFDANFSSSQTVAFVGIGTIDEMFVKNYCNFDPSDGMHQQLRTLNQARKRLAVQKMAHLISVSLLSIAITWIVSTFRRKEEIKTFRNYRFAGGRSPLMQLIAVELMFLIPHVLINAIVGLVCFSTSWIVLLCGTALLGWLLNLLIVAIRVWR